MLRLFARWILLTTPVFLGAVGLIRAQPYDSQGLEAILSVPPNCAAPCWQGIRPGETNGPTALALVGKVEAVRDLQSQLDAYPGHIFWHWRGDHPVLATPDGLWAYVWLQEDVVSNIFLPGVRHFADLYLLLGQPEKIVIYSDSAFASGIVVYLSVYPDQMYLTSFITCRSDMADLWRAPSNIHLGRRPFYEGAIEREFLPSELHGWLPDQLCLRG